MKRHVRWLAALAAAIALAGSPVRADEPEPVPGGATPILHGELRLSLADAIAMGIENNLDVEIARHAPLIAEQDAQIAWGAFDPESFADYGYADVETPVQSSLQLGGLVETRTWDGQAGFRGLVPFVGASYEIGYSGQEVKTNQTVSTLSPEFEAQVRAEARVPLMRDLIWNEPWTQVKLTRIAVGTAWEEFQRALMDTIRDVEDAYWNLIARQEGLRVAKKSLETAEALLEQARAQYEVGVVSKVEVVEAEAGVAQRDFDRIVAENAYRRAQDELIDQVLGPHLRPTSTLEFEPTETSQLRIRNVDEEQAMEKALHQRPELAAVRKLIEQREVELRFARNQRLPRLDLEGSYGFQGLAGRRNPDSLTFSGVPQPITVGSRYSHTDDKFFSDSGARQWSARGLFSIPLGNVEGRHRVSKAELELRRARTQARRVEQDIVLEIREAARNLRSAIEGIDAAERRRLAAAEQLRAERVRLEHGESTPFNVLEREEDLVEAESQRIEAQRIYHTSVTAVERSQGTILSSHNIVIDAASALR
jgi:outer membrane protein TolC